jgi:hypothetical protein
MASDIRVGDLLRLSTAARVLTKIPYGVYVQDVSTGFQHTVSNDELKRAEVIEEAKPAVRKAKTGDILSAQDVFDITWKRGSVIQNLDNPEYVLMLEADGTWRNQNGNYMDFRSFKSLAEFDFDTKYKVLHAA